MQYRKGFVTFPETADFVDSQPVSGWSRLVLHGWALVVHPDAQVLVMPTLDGRTVAVVGDVFVAHGAEDLASLLARFGRGDHAALDDLSGKFAAIAYGGESPRAVQDPIGSQTVFYSATNPIAGSHAALVAEVSGVKMSREVRRYMATDEYKARTTRFLPGDLSLFDSIFLLVPNNELNVASSCTARYWPHQPIPASDVGRAHEVWDEYFSNYASYLRPRYRPVLGLTGGVDSKGAIASLRAHNTPMRYVTWDVVSEREREVIGRTADHLGGDHRWIEKQYRSTDPWFQDAVDAAKSAAGYTRGASLLPAQTAHGGDPRDLFIFGHGSGIMRGSYSLAVKPWLPVDPLKRAYALYAGPARKDASITYRDFTLNAYRGFLKRGNYHADLYGADVGDLLYWESRMANWASLLIATFDVTMNAHSALNSRRLYETFWGIDSDYRYSKDLNRDIMRSYDPALASIA